MRFKEMNYFCQVLIVFFLSACQSAPTSQLLSDRFQHQETVQLIEVNYPADSLGKPDFIYSFGDWIVLSEPHYDDLLSVYNMRTGAFQRFLKKGRGANELLDVQHIGASFEDACFFVKSTFGAEIYIYTLSNDSAVLQQKIKTPEDLVSMFWDDTSIVSSQYGQQRYSVCDTEFGTCREFGDSITFRDFPQRTISHILQGLCTGSAALHRMAWFSIYGDAFEIYDYKQFSRITQYVGILPIVDVQQNQPNFSLDSKLGVPSVTSNDEYIFVLYNEKTLREALTLRDDVFLSQKLLIFDWKGNPVKLLKMNQSLRSISYNKQQHLLYGIGYDDASIGKIYTIDF
jgi:hypothetical protein